MNPFDLQGSDFLGLYSVVFVAALALAVYLRWHLRQPESEPPAALELSPYEVAYLAGGPVLAVNAAIARLVHEEALAADAAARKLTVAGTGPRPNAPELERLIFAAVDPEKGETIATVRVEAASALEPIRKGLQDAELVMADDRAWTARWIPLLLVLAVPVFGAVKIIIGVSREKSVFYLVVLCILSALVGAFVVGRAVMRSRRGDRALARLKEENAALGYSSARKPTDLAGDDLALALGLFGMGVLAGGPLTNLQTALKPRAGSSSCGGGCGGGGCGGGGGGGDGGGCGGGGCGGCGG